MSVDLTADIVRILTSKDMTAGTGFVVTDDGLIATCAHVVEVAGAGPGGNVRVVFHSDGEGRDAKVEPDWWRAPDAEDVNNLRLEGPVPAQVEPVPLGSSVVPQAIPSKPLDFLPPKTGKACGAAVTSVTLPLRAVRGCCN